MDKSGCQQRKLAVSSDGFFEFFCQQCEEDGDHIEAVGYCASCDAYLCGECYASHRKPKSLRTHVLLGIAEMTRQRPSIKCKDIITEICSQHAGRTIAYFCGDHEQLACSLCVSMLHKGCEGMQYIPEVSQDPLGTHEHKEFLKQLRSLSLAFTRIKNKSGDNISMAHKTHEQVVATIQHFRKEIDGKLDELEKNILREVHEMMTDDIQKITLTVEKCTAALEEIHTMNSTHENLLVCKQNSQLYIQMKTGKDSVVSLKELLSDVETNYGPRHYTFQPNTRLTDTLKSGDVLGTISFKADTNISTETLRTKDLITPTPPFDKCIHVKTFRDRQQVDGLGTTPMLTNNLFVMEWKNENIQSPDIQNPILSDKLHNTAAIEDKTSTMTFKTKRHDTANVDVDEDIKLCGNDKQQPDSTGSAILQNSRLVFIDRDKESIMPVDMLNVKLIGTPCSPASLVETGSAKAQTKKPTATCKTKYPDTPMAVFDRVIFVRLFSDKQHCNITGSVLLPNGRLIVTDWNNENVKLIDTLQNKVLSYLTVPHRPRDITQISENQVAITLYNDMIMFLRVGDNLSVHRGIKVDNCLGLTYFPDRLVVTRVFPPRVEIMTLQEEILAKIATDSTGNDLFKCPEYVAVSPDHQTLYVSDVDANTVTSLTMHGSMIARYIDRDLQGPQKLVVDQSGIVFVCCRSSNNVHVLTDDLKIVKVILSSIDEIKEPNSISLCNVTQKLFLNSEDYIKVFQLS